mmetsp:Transcript_27813/g.50539  ORF Transcript_27813/g.50539 Transcript_27813/m.50539 type:complete len:113 (-) Transcript_27813:810-1148(-)
MFMDEEGELREVKKAAVGGVISEGMFCDSRMLGWISGGHGVAAQVPSSFELGSAPPASKPRAEELIKASTEPEAEVKGLFEKKLTKEEKKRLAEEKRQARRAAKEKAKEETQ